MDAIVAVANGPRRRSEIRTAMLMVLQVICIRVKAPRTQAFQISPSERLAGSGPILWRKWCWDNVDLDLDPQLLGCATFANFA